MESEEEDRHGTRGIINQENSRPMIISDDSIKEERTASGTWTSYRI